MDAKMIEALLDEMKTLIAALRAGEIARANELLVACKVPQMAAAGEIPAGPEGNSLREAVEEALSLSLEMQTAQRKAVAQGGATSRALGAYRMRRR